MRLATLVLLGLRMILAGGGVIEKPLRSLSSKCSRGVIVGDTLGEDVWEDELDEGMNASG